MKKNNHEELVDDEFRRKIKISSEVKKKKTGKEFEFYNYVFHRFSYIINESYCFSISIRVIQLLNTELSVETQFSELIV